MAIPAMMRRSTGNRTPWYVKAVPFGRSEGTETVSVPKRYDTIDCSASIRPIDAATLASAGACRSGRNTRKWTARPRSIAVSDREREARPDGHAARRADPHEPGQARYRQQVFAGSAQPEVDVGDVHPERALGEVDDAGASIGEHHAESDEADDGARAEPKDGVQQVVADCSPRMRADYMAAARRVAQSTPPCRPVKKVRP